MSRFCGRLGDGDDIDVMRFWIGCQGLHDIQAAVNIQLDYFNCHYSRHRRSRSLRCRREAWRFAVGMEQAVVFGVFGSALA